MRNTENLNGHFVPYRNHTDLKDKTPEIGHINRGKRPQNSTAYHI